MTDEPAVIKTAALLGTCCALTMAPAFAADAPPKASQVRQRADVPAAYRWDFSAIFPDWAAWEAAMREMEAKMDAFAARKGSLAQGPQAVLDAYRAYDEIGRLQYLVYRYPGLQRDIDTRDQAVAARFQRVGALFARFTAATSWFTPELLRIPEATLRKWIAATPALEPYAFTILDSYRQQAHVLDEAGERLLALSSRLSQNPREAFQQLSTADIRFPTIRTSDGQDVTLTPGRYAALLEGSAVQADRAAAARAHVGAYASTVHTFAALYHGVLERDWFTAQARRFESTLDAALDGNAIPRAVVENLVARTRAGTAPLQRYARLRQRMLGLGELHLYDSFVPLVRSEQTYPYDQALELVLASVAPLGADYQAKYRRFVSSGRVDVFETEGKRSGAYNAGVYGVGPYLLLNHNDTLDALFTLAHEGGHAMHTVLSYETQPFVTADYTIFVAEVASTMNERFLLEHLLGRTDDPKQRFGLLQHAVDQIVGTFYTQVMFADFELQAHRLVEQGQPITVEVLNRLYGQLLRQYWGDALVVDAFYEPSWARIAHFFNSPYYVYQYATCFASSAELYRAMTVGDADARRAATDRYLTLLRSGGNDHPMEQLKKAGVDLTRPGAVQAVIEQMDELVARMEVEAARIRP